MKYQKLLSEFEGQLDALESGNGDVLFKAEKGIALVEKCIRKLQKQITGKTFATQSDEIYFFKHVKPQIFSKLIYYARLFSIESKRPRGNNAAQIKYLQNIGVFFVGSRVLFKSSTSFLRYTISIS